MKSKSGFTLAELIMSTVVIGIIACCLIPFMNAKIKVPGITGNFLNISDVGIKRNIGDTKFNKIFNLQSFTVYQKGQDVVFNDPNDSTYTKIDCKAITDIYQLKKINENPNGCYVLMDDINFKKSNFDIDGNRQERATLNHNFESIANFTGLFLGNGKILYNMDKPLFDNLSSSAVVQDFGIHDSDIVRSQTDTTSEIGFLAKSITGSGSMRIRNVYVKNSSIKSDSSKIKISQASGGLVGKCGDSIGKPTVAFENCYNDSQQAAAGGFVGVSYGNLSFNNCFNQGDISADLNGYVGGFVGKANGSVEISRSANVRASVTNTFTQSEDIEGNKKIGVGGFVGYAEKLKIKESYSHGDLKVTSSVNNVTSSAGGLAAVIEKSVTATDFYTLGDFIAGDFTGGFVGRIAPNADKDDKPDVSLICGYTLATISGSSAETISGVLWGQIAETASVTTKKLYQYSPKTGLTTDDAEQLNIKKETGGKITFPFNKDKFSYEEEEGETKINVSNWTKHPIRPILKNNREFILNELYYALNKEEQILKKCLTGKDLADGETRCGECAKLCDNETEENKDFYSLSYCSIACGLCGNGENGENFCNQECTPQHVVTDSKGGAFCYTPDSEYPYHHRRGTVQFVDLPKGKWFIHAFGASGLGSPTNCVKKICEYGDVVGKGGLTYGVLSVGDNEIKKLMLIVPSFGQGGGCADIRYNSNATQNTANSFNLVDRILVAGGGGGSLSDVYELMTPGEIDGNISFTSAATAASENSFTPEKKSNKGFTEIVTGGAFTGAGGGCTNTGGTGAAPGEADKCFSYPTDSSSWWANVDKVKSASNGAQACGFEGGLGKHDSETKDYSDNITVAIKDGGFGGGGGSCFAGGGGYVGGYIYPKKYPALEEIGGGTGGSGFVNTTYITNYGYKTGVRGGTDLETRLGMVTFLNLELLPEEIIEAFLEDND